jgi:hypothetical protein
MTVCSKGFHMTELLTYFLSQGYGHNIETMVEISVKA